MINLKKKNKKVIMWDICVNKLLLLETRSLGPHGLSLPLWWEINKCWWIEKTFIWGFFVLKFRLQIIIYFATDTATYHRRVLSTRLSLD